ncbi:hypothetical protein HBI56_218430 [Parastagonospora nodorum]|uniref:Uncharacterized protein n=2 Tax=Phaeosphaeria nodorum (strain SN15 / ATCC MYA-4574 / FGSC 10173) TaxID=321614 RepID=A0A7U2I6N3_PHANO|nr:hypothetical protein SNOG_04836 [Parastagonospora nodorum SN15]KAH3904970.1 hypothetical protein HBH56_225630 [Parastagonospora nodorum]EAT87227.1 hypothetical protein SNOG_04836 [Parastagonospora nodorum SN15]KAH3935964.1 hypothetical protein HBH54_033100 [Parastagonospora nodorum]KAH3940039.1 hypothetical protein HBH53_223670 [Parastagonospora nodorum]KAH3957592.1 hypothetical protein HBH51_223040 [Parastagonospora nodorum]
MGNRLPAAIPPGPARLFLLAATTSVEVTAAGPWSPLRRAWGIVYNAADSRPCACTPVDGRPPLAGLSNARHGLSVHAILCRLDSGTAIWEGRSRQAPMPLCR